MCCVYAPHQAAKTLAACEVVEALLLTAKQTYIRRDISKSHDRASVNLRRACTRIPTWLLLDSEVKMIEASINFDGVSRLLKEQITNMFA